MVWSPWDSCAGYIVLPYLATRTQDQTQTRVAMCCDHTISMTKNVTSAFMWIARLLCRLCSDPVYHTLSMTKNVTSPSMWMARLQCLFVCPWCRLKNTAAVWYASVVSVHALLSDHVYDTISMTKNVTSPSMWMARLRCLLFARGADANMQAHVEPVCGTHTHVSYD